MSAARSIIPNLPRLYVITDRASAARGCGSVVDAVEAAIGAGARAFQLRDKGRPTDETWQLGQRLAKKINDVDGMLLVNARADVARGLGAQGVHRPRSGLPIREMRAILGENAIIGVSAHNVQEVLQAEQDGASFATLSPIFPTASKPGYGPTLGLETLKEACDACEIPIFALAGVTPERCTACIEAGAYGVAVMGGVMGASDPGRATADYLRHLNFKQL